MQRFIYIAVLGVIFCNTFAQQIPEGLYLCNEKITFKQGDISSKKEEVKSDVIARYLIESVKNLQCIGCGLTFEYERQSLSGKHFAFTQTFQDIPIFGSQLKVNTDKKGNIRSVVNHTYNISSIYEIEDVTTDEVSSFNLEEWVQSRYGNSTQVNSLYPVWFINEVSNSLNYAYHININNLSNAICIEVILDNNLNILYEKDQIVHFADTTARGMVFLPDPLTTAGEDYGIPYIDNDDADIEELNAQRFEVSFPTDFENDSFLLRNNFMEIVDFQAPYNPVTKSKTGDFFYTRADSNFEAVNAYYHTYNFQQYVWSLGFTQLPDTSLYYVHIDPSAGYGDESYFRPPVFGTTLRIGLGYGGVDDAEDADVIVHEYGHALSYAAAPGSNEGDERKAIDEAIGDYFATTYSRNYNDYRWADVFTWDGHNEFWSGRSVNTNKHYPEAIAQLSPENLHLPGEVWSSGLIDIREQIGWATTDSLVFEYLYTQFRNMTMRDAAILFIQTDSLVTNGKNSRVIHQAFCKRGFIEPVDSLDCEHEKFPNTHLSGIFNRGVIQFLNSAKFATGEASLYIHLPQQTPASLMIYNLMGQHINTFNFNSQNIKIKPYSIPKGVYIFKIRTNDNLEAVHKIVKLQ